MTSHIISFKERKQIFEIFVELKLPGNLKTCLATKWGCYSTDTLAIAATMHVFPPLCIVVLVKVWIVIML